MKNLLIATLVTTIATLAHAEPYQVQQGLDKIKTNFENSKANKVEYDKNLGIVNNNIAEISKAKASVLKQKADVGNEIVKNNDSLKKVLLQEKDIQAYIKAEQDKMDAEAKQIKQLDALIDQIQKNQDQRAANIAKYQEQLKAAADEKVAWKAREGELRNQEGETIKVIRTVATEEANWTNRKKGYEIEVKRWSSEADKQKTIFDTYQGLKEEK